MTFRGDLLSSRSLAGLATLLVTFAAVPPERSFDRWSEDTGIYSNAVLEAGRFLHDDYAIDHAPDTRDRIAALMNSLDSLGGAFFRYAMVSEFESRVQESMLKGEVPTGARLSEIYLELLRRYYGHDEGVVFVDEMFAREWISYRVPFLSFETLNFPLAAAAAAQLIEKARKGDADTRDGFLHLLGRGEIDLSYPLLKRAGADLATDGPYKAVARRMNSLMNELERTLHHKK
jgi:oligoendopeptidase F